MLQPTSASGSRARRPEAGCVRPDPRTRLRPRRRQPALRLRGQQPAALRPASRMTAWKDVYRGKSDYLYYFLSLAVEKLAPGGRLCVITPAGWMNAGNADWLRATPCRDRCGSTSSSSSAATACSRPSARRVRRHRAPTPTVESAILIATKAKPPKVTSCGSSRWRTRPRPRGAPGEADATLAGPRPASGGDGRASSGRQGARAESTSTMSGRPTSSHTGPGRSSTARGRRSALSRISRLRQTGRPSSGSGERWHIPQGIQTGADAYTPPYPEPTANAFPKAEARLMPTEPRPASRFWSCLPGGSASRRGVIIPRYSRGASSRTRSSTARWTRPSTRRSSGWAG